MKDSISKGFGKESSHYYMAEKGFQCRSEEEGFPLHYGPVHIGLIFYSLESIKE